MNWERTVHQGLLSTALAAGFVASAGLAGASDVPEWVRQFGTTAGDFAYRVSTSADGDLYVAGTTTGSLGGVNRGYFDAWVSKRDSDGQSSWTRQIGTEDMDFAYGVATTADGSVYVTGWSYGSLAGANRGGADCWLAKYNAEGDAIWQRSFGTPDGDFAMAAAADPSGSVYVAGSTTGSLGGAAKGGVDPWIAKYNANGHLQWKRQPGSALDDAAEGVATDDLGNVYVTGYTQGSIGGPNAGDEDAWLAKYDANGHRVWVRQFGGKKGDFAYAVATDANGGVYVAGYTFGAFGAPNQGNEDAWLVRYEADTGRRQWKRMLGTPASDFALDVSTDTEGNALLTGVTFGALGGPHEGDQDAWVAKYDAAGNELWRRQLGTSALDAAYGIATDRGGNLFLGGSTNGALDGSNRGDADAWVAKYPTVP